MRAPPYENVGSMPFSKLLTTIVKTEGWQVFLCVVGVCWEGGGRGCMCVCWFVCLFVFVCVFVYVFVCVYAHVGLWLLVRKFVRTHVSVCALVRV